jgi:UTP:GlnB (protein PII) uridylyltransferase
VLIKLVEQVEVMKRDPGGMEVRIVCANRPGLLVDVMEAVESRGLTITHARIACHGDDIVVKYLSLEVR